LGIEPGPLDLQPGPLTTRPQRQSIPGLIIIIINIIIALLLQSIHTGKKHHRYRSGPLKNEINIKCNYNIVRQL
jgi:hypothetical protein